MVQSFKGLFGGGEWGAAPATPAQVPQPSTGAPRVPTEVNSFVERYTADPAGGGYTAAEAKAMLDAISKVATPDVMRRALQQTLEQMTPEQRAELFVLMMGDRGAAAPGPAGDPGSGKLFDMVTEASQSAPPANEAAPSAPAKPEPTPKKNPFEGVMDSPLEKILAGGVAAFAAKEILQRMTR